MALPADGLTTRSDMVTTGTVVSALIPQAFKEASIWMNLVYSEDLPADAIAKKFRISGSVIAEAVTEGSVYTPSDTNSDLTDTSVTITAAKAVVGSPISVEALRFGGNGASLARVADEQGRALARLFDDDCNALINSITLAATASSTLTTDTLLEGQYKVLNALCPPGPLVAVLDFKGVYELQKLVVNAGAAVWTNALATQFISGVPQANNYRGNFLGIDIYATTGLSETGSDDQGVIFNPRYAFASVLGGAPETNIRWTGHGVASQVAGFSYEVSTHMFYGVGLWHDSAACEIRSDT